MADAVFEDPRLAQVYDPLDPDRSDLDVYAALVDELAIRSVLDIGCGTGTFASMLATRGTKVIAVDPAAASLEVARSKTGAERVRWLHGDATTLPPLEVDAAFMTGNVAQVFLTDRDWSATLRACRQAVRPGGWLVFETRDPARRAWEGLTPELTRTVANVSGVGEVESWAELTAVAGQLVTFRSTIAFRRDDIVLESVSTLRFRNLPEVEASLVTEGFEVADVRDAPDRPGLEFVFLARRPQRADTSRQTRLPEAGDRGRGSASSAKHILGAPNTHSSLRRFPRSEPASERDVNAQTPSRNQTCRPTVFYTLNEKAHPVTVMIGIDPHKGSHTAVAVDHSERSLAALRSTTPKQVGASGDQPADTSPASVTATR